jgi:hypothetical protein
MSDLLADLYRAAAADLEARDHSNVPFLAGPQAWAALHAAARDLITGPLAEGARRRAGVPQLQDWRADKETVVKTLRDLADAGEQLDLLRDADADHRITTATQVLREAFGWPANDHKPLETIADDAAQELRVLRAENQRLRDELARRTDHGDHGRR